MRKPSRENRKIPTWVWINAIEAVLSVGIFIFASSQVQEIGFPLDDAWIHQTYARNLAELGEWAFIPGSPTAGSTSPMWTLLLALVHVISPGIPFYLTFSLGAVCLWLLACAAEAISRKTTGITGWFPSAGLFMAAEWHLVWAGASGMETAFMALLIAAVFLCLVKGSSKLEVAAGALAGLAVWVRPDAITLIGPIAFVQFFRYDNWKSRIKYIGLALAASFLPVAAYLGFNCQIAGQIWPNTFYAKQAEYASMQQVSIFLRYGRLLVLPLIGAGVLLVPGFIYETFRAVKKHEWFWIAAILWWLGYNLLFALRLPVTYQHGRYLMPAMPIYFLIGLIGTYQWIVSRNSKRGFGWVIKQGWTLSVALVLVAFVGIGAKSYSTDVAIINTEMVDTAKWIHLNTNPTDLIAVHDIGAVGYFSQRDIIDLAGLVTPEVVPIIRDETALRKLLDDRGAAYLMTFPDWYNDLTQGKMVVYQSTSPFSNEAGGENMTVFLWLDQ